MSNQYANDIPFSTSHHQEAFKLIELPSELLALLESDTPPTLSITSSPPSTPGIPTYALLTTTTTSPTTNQKTYQLRQKNTSNPIMILSPSTTGPTFTSGLDTFIPQPSICAVAKCEDTIELIVVDLEKEARDREKGAPGKVNKWHEKFAKSRAVGKKD